MSKTAPRKAAKVKFHIRRGDVVKVIAGDHKGAEGKVLEVVTKKSRAVVEGVRLIKKHVRRTQDNPEGGITEREGGIHVSNLKLVKRADDIKKEK
jgi:large subunit ribosomal protein L24